MRSVIREVYDGTRTPDQDSEDRFFTRVRLPTGVYKTTSRNRLDDLNELAARLLPEVRPLELMDVGISSGVTTSAWSDQLTAAGIPHRMVAGDSDLQAWWLSLGWAELLLDRDRKRVIYADVLGRALTGGDSKKATLVARLLDFVARLISLLRPRLRQLQLVSPRLVETDAITVVEDDIFTVAPQLRRRFHALRAANILNRAYFDDERVRLGLVNLRDRLRPDGLLIVCRTHDDGTNHGTIFKLSDGRLTTVARLGEGSEIEDLVTSL